MNSVYTQIQRYYDDLSSTEQLVIDFMLKYDDLSNLKLKVIQDELHISASTIIRAVKKLSYKSFTEFKYALINSRLSFREPAPKQDFKTVLSTIVSDFNKTIDMMEEEKLDIIASTILQSRHIFCMGIGSSASVVNSLNRKLKNLGLWSNDYTDVFPMRDVPSIANEQDCMIVFSLSGNEKEMVDVVAECKVSGIKIISITALSSNPIASLSDITLMVHQTIQNRKKLRSRLMLMVASEIIFETVLLKSR